jgi:hypothetical protein
MQLLVYPRRTGADMKLLLLIGGLLGFGIGFAFSWVKQNAWPSILLHACVGAYLGGLLFRWWGRSLLKSLVAAADERRAQFAAVKFTPASRITKS